MRGVAFTKYGDRAASTRVRIKQYGQVLENNGISIELLPLLDNHYLDRIFAHRRTRLAPVAGSYLSRGLAMRRRSGTAFAWLHCESFPYLPGFMERLILTRGEPVIYDFDDAIFHQYDLHPNPLVRQILGRKLEPILRGASLAICGNAYLEQYAARFCRRTEVVPSVVDTTIYRPRPRRDPARPLTLGWIGSPSTWSYLQPLLPLFLSLQEELGLRISVVGAGPQGSIHPSVTFHDWSEKTEVGLIQDMDIGIMPLPDEPWARGKCGYKLIQYMACGLPVIASPVGVNAELVEDGLNGFHARNAHDWATAIRTLAKDPSLRASLSENGRRKVEAGYSLHVQGPRLARMIREVVDA